MGSRVFITIMMSLLFIINLSTPVLESLSTSNVEGREAVVRMDISPSPPISVDADSQLQFSATMYDSNDQQVLGSPNWWTSSGSIDSGGMFTPSIAGLVNLSASKDGVNETFNFTVEAGWPENIDIYSNSSSVMLGNSIDVQADLKDSKGNVISDKTISWISDCGIVSEQGVWTPDAIGTCIITAYWNELSNSIHLNATAGTPAKIVFGDNFIVKSGQSIELQPQLQDEWGNQLDLSNAGTLSWQMESGTVTSGWIYIGDIPGIWNISVSSTSGATGYVNITVRPATIESLELQQPSSVILAGEEIELQVIRTDIFGHQTNSTPPLANWTLYDGSLRQQNGKIIWSPNQVGNWTISVSDEGYQDSIQVEVIHGYATSLVLATDNDRMTADEAAIIWMQVSDNRSNRWIVNGSWEMQSIEAIPWLEDHSSWARFEAVKVGNWSVDGEWFDVERQILLKGNLTLEVIPGVISNINLLGEGVEVSTDYSLDLSPTFFDSDGNQIGFALLNWTLIREGVESDRTVDLRLSKGVFHPDTIGSHEIRARSGSAHTSVRFHVGHGTARTLSVDISDSFQVVSGMEGAIQLSISASDLSGSNFAVDDLQWQMDDAAGNFSADALGVGKWIFEGYQVGEWQVTLLSGHASYTLTVTVLPGPAHRLEAGLSAIIVEQGSDILLTVKAYDEHNNSLALDSSDTSVHSTSGDATSLGGGIWRIETAEGGANHGVTIRHGELTQQRFFDVDEALLSGAFGSSNGALVVGSSLIVIVLIVLLVIRTKARKATPDDETYYEESEYVLHQAAPVAAVAPQQMAYAAPIAPVAVVEAVVPQQSVAQAAEKARQTGVMVAAQGTVQGQTGWYYDTTGELTCWNVDASGGWSRIQ